MNLTNKIIWITGASSGIGEALVNECAKHRAKLVSSSRREEELKRVVKQANLKEGDYLILPFDLSDTSKAWRNTLSKLLIHLEQLIY